MVKHLLQTVDPLRSFPVVSMLWKWSGQHFYLSLH